MKSARIVRSCTHHLTFVMLVLSVFCAGIASGGGASSGIAEADTVKITPIGSHAGEFCRNDRALLFEDPTGVRVLWDPGRTTSEADPRLGNVHVIILSSVHADHIGEVKPNLAAPGTCAAPGTVSAAPNSVTAAIAAAKNSAVLVGGEMSEYLARKIQNIRGVPTPGCPAAGLANEMTVPRTSPCTATLRPGGSRTVVFSGETAGVKFANIPAFHSNGIPSNLVDNITFTHPEDGADHVHSIPGIAPGTTGYGGNDGGFVVEFTNGLTVYLTGDTGLFGDMETIVRKFYRPNLVVINMGDIFSLGPDEAAFAIKELVKPRTVIPSHANEEATLGGAVRAGTRVERFIEQVSHSRTDVVVPLSGVMQEFDGRGRCVSC